MLWRLSRTNMVQNVEKTYCINVEGESLPESDGVEIFNLTCKENGGIFDKGSFYAEKNSEMSV